MSETGTTAPIKDEEQFADTPQGWSARWQTELQAAQKVVKPWHKQADQIVKRFLDDRQGGNYTGAGLATSAGVGGVWGTSRGGSRLNLFTSNIQTLRSLLYGKIPSVDVDRRFNDADDDEARVAAEMLQRLLNSDIEDPDDSYSTTLVYALDDKLMVGMGNARVRYEVEMEDQDEVPAMMHPETGMEMAPAYTPEPMKTEEEVCIDYVYWRDFLWSPARVWSEVRWIAFRNYMTLDAGVKRFGEKFRDVPMKSPKRSDTANMDQGKRDPWDKAEVWEIWDKDNEAVFWYVEGFDEILDVKEDPLEVEGFFPCPRPMFSNLTTSGVLPRPDFVIAQDLYNEIDMLETRIAILTPAIKAVGCYDKAAEGVRRMMQEGVENDLVPVDNWAAFAEKGGIKGATDWLPITQIVSVIETLTGIRDNKIQLLYQVTGMSDIMRGEATQPNATATEQSIKSKFASVRVQAMQDEFARFASDLQRLKASIIVKHFDDQNIVGQTNIMRTPDAPLVPGALKLLRDDFAEYRISIKSEALSMTDYAALKQERTTAIQGMAGFIAAAQPLVEKFPSTGPMLLEIMKWGMAGFKGASQMESMLDQAIAGIKQEQQQPKQPPPPDPKIQAQKDLQQAKTQGKLVEIGASTKAKMQEIHATTQSEVVQQAAQAKFDTHAREHEAVVDEDAQRMAHDRAQGMAAVENITKRPPS